MRRTYWILGGVVLCAAGVGFGLPALAHRALGRELARRGFEGGAAALRFSPAGVEVRELVASVPSGRIRLAPRRVFVKLDYLRMSPEEVLVEGGSVELKGGPSELRGALSNLRESGSPGASATAQRYVTIRGLEVRWTEPFGSGSNAHLGNVQLDRGPGGTKFGSDLVTLERGEWGVSAAGVVVDWTESAEGLGVEKASAAEVRVRSKSVAPEPDGGKASSAVASGGNDVPEWLLLDEERPEALRSALRRLRAEVLPLLPERAEVRRVSLEVGEGDRALHLGPGELRIERVGDVVRFSLTPDEARDGKKLSLSLGVARFEGPTELTLRGGPVSLADLGVRPGQLGLARVGEAFLSGDGSVTLDAPAERIEASGRIDVTELTIERAGLAPGPVTVPRLSVEGKLLADVSGASLVLDPGALAIGETSLKVSVVWTRKESVKLEAKAKVPLVSCQSLLTSAPLGMLGAVADVRAKGTFSVDASVSFDSLALAKSKVSLDAHGDCEVTSVPEALDPAQFRRVFTREVEGPGGAPLALEFGPLTSTWTGLSDLPPTFEKALLVTEDGRFFRHSGFDPRAIESSVIDNVKAGRFVRGASTVSMQLAKNLYLGREKQLSRKLREIVLTLVLEQSFEKKELLELYANVVEFGPFVYGIRAAAQYYFGALPEELTTAQVFFLASILPNPKKTHFDRSGALARGARAHVHRLLDVALARKLLTSEETDRAKKEELVFGRKETSPELPAAGSSPEGVSARPEEP